MADIDKTYIGFVEDNDDPKKLGRVRIRVMDVFDNIPVEDIPWAQPWKDLNGNTFNVPEKGKVVMVVFDQGDQNRPEFIYSDHYNINLEKKLESLSGSNYTSMKSVIFDHKTQIYVNDDEGLKIDHKYNNLNITEDTIDLNLKDNNRSVNIGDATAGQQAILGNHWMDWFDKFVDNLLGSKAGPFLGNLGAPVIANPAFISCLLEYKALRDPVFLSHHVNIVDNNKVTTVGKTDREDDPQLGDSWTSTKHENTQTQKVDENFKPVEGPKKEFDETAIPSETQSNSNNSNNPPVVNPITGEQTDLIIGQATQPAPTFNNDLKSIKSNPLIDKLVRFMNSKSYKVYETTDTLNIVAMRTKNELITNKFDDILYVFYKNTQGNWEIVEYFITTLPGLKVLSNEEIEDGSQPQLPSVTKLLALGQYIDQCYLVKEQNRKYLKFKNCNTYTNTRVDKYIYSSELNNEIDTLEINFPNVSSASLETVYNYSTGSQVFKTKNQYLQFINLCEKHIDKNSNNITYSLCRKSDFDDFV